VSCDHLVGFNDVQKHGQPPFKTARNTYVTRTQLELLQCCEEESKGERGHRRECRDGIEGQDSQGSDVGAIAHKHWQ